MADDFLGGGPRFLQHVLDQVDAATRPVQFIAQQLVRGAGGGAKIAVHLNLKKGTNLIQKALFLTSILLILSLFKDKIF